MRSIALGYGQSECFIVGIYNWEGSGIFLTFTKHCSEPKSLLKGFPPTFVGTFEGFSL